MIKLHFLYAPTQPARAPKVQFDKNDISVLKALQVEGETYRQTCEIVQCRTSSTFEWMRAERKWTKKATGNTSYVLHGDGPCSFGCDMLHAAPKQSLELRAQSRPSTSLLSCFYFMVFNKSMHGLVSSKTQKQLPHFNAFVNFTLIRFKCYLL